MALPTDWGHRFARHTIRAGRVDPSGQLRAATIEVRTHPITGRTCRITFARMAEKEPGTEHLPAPPPHADQRERCPFCAPQVWTKTPRLIPGIDPDGRMRHGRSLLFPNLFPYGAWSAVSLFDDTHFVEIGTASAHSYADCLINGANYLGRVRRHDPDARFMAITQNHLPSAGGSLVHPHLQIQADAVAANHHRWLARRARDYRRRTGGHLLGDYLNKEVANEERIIATSGPWTWLAAFAPEGFYEIWAICPGQSSLLALSAEDWGHLADGMIRVQRFYRSLNRNGYNFGLISQETVDSALELRAVMVVRSNFSPWSRSDHTGYEVMLGEMATFSAPEETAKRARRFFDGNPAE